MTIVEGVFNSVLCNCLPLFGGCTQSQIDTLQVLQNRAARLSLGCPPRSNRDWMFSELQWMTVLQLVAYHTLVTVFRIRSHRQPEYLASKLCRDSRQGRILAENSCLDIYRKSFVFRGISLWNRLPSSIRETEKIRFFKKGVRVWIFNNIDRFKI